MAGTQTLFRNLVCSKTLEEYDKASLQTYSTAHKPLLAHYDLQQGLSKQILQGRPFNMWRYRELLPVEQDEHIISLGEGGTPLLRLKKLSALVGAPAVFLKEEGYNPTGSFKSRGLSAAISKAREFGIDHCVIPTAGNAGGAMSAYCALAGIQAHVYMPRLTPLIFQQECQLFGAQVTLVDGDISDCAKRIATEKQDNWFDISTLKEPYRLEGKKTMGFEIAEQLGWQVPDVILYPTGGGTGLIGIWKAFAELEKLGWIGSQRPRMVAVQVAECAPIVRAFDNKLSYSPAWENPGATMANGLRVPAAFGDELIMDILYRSQGKAVAVSESEIKAGLHEAAQLEGKLLCPEGAAVWMAYKRLLREDWIDKQETAVLLNTGSMYKYMENL